MEDPRKAFLESINIDDSSVINHPGFVFFCGGEICGDEGRHSSVRDYLNGKFVLYHEDIYLDRFILAESIEAWQYKDHYGNLIDLEKDIAYLADRIILVVESPGSIAELGAFSVLEEFSQKLVVFLSKKDHDMASFLRLGPIDYLRSKRKDSIKVYPWVIEYTLDNNNIVTSVDGREIEGFYSDIASDILEDIPKKDRKDRFDIDLPNHVMLLIADMVELFHILKVSEKRVYGVKSLLLHSTFLPQTHRRFRDILKPYKLLVLSLFS